MTNLLAQAKEFGLGCLATEQGFIPWAKSSVGFLVHLGRGGGAQGLCYW